MKKLDALVISLKSLAKVALESSAGAESDYAKGLFDGAALAYEFAAQSLERELEGLK